MKINIKQISDKTGFSPATVSNALNQKHGVNRETAEVIIRTARELGYMAGDSIHKIKLVVYRRTGLIIDGTPFFTQLINGFEKECRLAGFEMSIMYLDRWAEEFEEQVHQLLTDISCGVVLLGSELMEDDLDFFKDTACKFMTFDYWSTDMRYNGVTINNIDSVNAAVNYLIAHGHKRIGYLYGDFRIRAFCERESGYDMALAAHGLESAEGDRIELATTMDGAYADMKKYLEQKKDLPTAFFADNDMIALGAMKAMQEAGIRIPEDVSVIGFDDLPFSQISSPRLTSMKVPKQEMGEQAARCMIEILKNEHPAITRIQIGTEFMERDSVATI